MKNIKTNIKNLFEKFNKYIGKAKVLAETAKITVVTALIQGPAYLMTMSYATGGTANTDDMGKVASDLLGGIFKFLKLPGAILLVVGGLTLVKPIMDTIQGEDRDGKAVGKAVGFMTLGIILCLANGAAKTLGLYTLIGIPIPA